MRRIGGRRRSRTTPPAAARRRRGRGRRRHRPGDDRRDHELGAEAELIRHLVGVRRIRVLPVHRLDQRTAGFGGTVVHGVQVRHHRVAQTQRVHHRGAHVTVEVPRLLAGERRVGRMQSVDRAERAELVPAGLQLFVAVAEHVAADVVAPPAIPDVGSGGGELRLEGERFPGHDRVSGEADRVAVGAGAGVPGEGERPVATAP